MQDEIKSVDAEQQGKQCSRDNRIPIGITGRVREHRKITLVFNSLSPITQTSKSKSEKMGMLLRFGAVRIICARHLW